MAKAHINTQKQRLSQLRLDLFIFFRLHKRVPVSELCIHRVDTNLLAQRTAIVYNTSDAC